MGIFMRNSQCYAHSRDSSKISEQLRLVAMLANHLIYSAVRVEISHRAAPLLAINRDTGLRRRQGAAATRAIAEQHEPDTRILA